MAEVQHDEQTYRRGTVAAATGFVVHLLLTIGVALMAMYAQSSAIFAAVWYLVAGLPIWAVLWALFNQHKLEHLESLEAEQLAEADEHAAALFDEAGEQLAVARRRLNGFYRWGLPLVSGLVGGYMLIVGGLLAYFNYNVLAGSEVLSDLLQSRTFLEDAVVNGPRGSVWWLLVLQLAAAFIGFLVARYVAGMTRVESWKLLRGGAGFMMGNAIAMAVLVLASLVTVLGYPLGYEAAAVIIPAMMAILGFEMLLSLLFDLYRPRTPGEVSRPAFDSRILGWFTSPESIGKIIAETLNYQFGFELSRSWLYTMLARAVLPLLLFALLILFLLSSIVVVGQQEQAVVTRLGKFVRVAQPGLSLKWPYPISSTAKYDVKEVRQVTVGSQLGNLRDETALLWTNQHAEDAEEYMVTAPTPVPGTGLGRDSLAAGLAGARLTVIYRLADLKNFTLVVTDADRLVSDVALAAMNQYFVTHDIDVLLTTARGNMEKQLRDLVQRKLDAIGTSEMGGVSGTGIEVVQVVLSAIHPPQDGEVASAFHENIDARQEKQTTIEEAKRQAIETLAGVAGSREQALALTKAINELERLREKLQLLERLHRDDRSLSAAQLEQLHATLAEFRQEVDAAAKNGALSKEMAASDEETNLISQLLEQTESADGESSQQVTEQVLPKLQQLVSLRESQMTEMLKQAGGEAAKISREAEAYALRVVVQQRAQANRFNFQLKAYEAAPRYYRMRQYLETLRDGLDDRRKVIMATESDTSPTLRLNLEQMGSQLDLIAPNE